MNELVSIYITTHNRKSKLKRSVNSVLAQDYPNIEIIIVDDGSSDGTEELCSSLQELHENIIVVRSDVAKGANHARNQALNVASGKFITGLDDDDEFLPNRISRFVENWDEKFSFLCTDVIHCYDERNIQTDGESIAESEYITLSDMIFDNAATNQIFTSLDRITSVRFDESVKKLQDWDCWIKIIDKYGAGKRLGENTYLMYHDEVIRVTNNQNYNDAYSSLVNRNKKIFRKEITDKEIQVIVNKKFDLLLFLSSRKEMRKIILRNTCFYRKYLFLKRLFNVESI